MPLTHLTGHDHIAAIDAEINGERIRVESELQKGPALLSGIRQQIEQRRKVLHPQLVEAMEAVSQAEADLRAF